MRESGLQRSSEPPDPSSRGLLWSPSSPIDREPEHLEISSGDKQMKLRVQIKFVRPKKLRFETDLTVIGICQCPDAPDWARDTEAVRIPATGM